MQHLAREWGGGGDLVRRPAIFSVVPLFNLKKGRNKVWPPSREFSASAENKTSRSHQLLPLNQPLPVPASHILLHLGNEIPIQRKYKGAEVNLVTQRRSFITGGATSEDGKVHTSVKHLTDRLKSALLFESLFPFRF